MLYGKSISLIIPCKNEGKGIARLIKKLPSYLDEIIVVDNNSTDNTHQEAKSAGAKVFKEARSVNGIGYGFSHLTGLKHAQGDYLFAMDGDDTYPSREIKNVLKYLVKNNLDVVSCNRLPLNCPTAISKTRKLGIDILNFEIKFLYGYPIKDTLTGMWAIKKEAINKLKLSEGGWDLSPEVKLSAIMNPSLRFSEYHIDHFKRDDSSVSKQKIWQTGLNHLGYIFKKRFTTYNPLLKLLSWNNYRIFYPATNQIIP